MIAKPTTAIRTGCFLAAALLLSPHAHAAFVTFHAAPPVPDADDIYNFAGASRDGLNVNDENGLDGPLNDNFTYVANDRPRQGQTFRPLPANQVYRLQAIWIQMVGYTDNGSNPEPGYAGTDTDLSIGGNLRFRLGTAGPDGITGLTLGLQMSITGTEVNNPAPGGKITTTNGSGLWIKIPIDSGPGPGGLAPGVLYGFDLTSNAVPNQQFEWLGTRENEYAGGNAYNGNLPGLTANDGESQMNQLMGDRVFLVQLVLVPEPHSLALATLAAVPLAIRRRRAA